MIDIDAPLPDEAAQHNVIDVAPPPPTVSTTIAALQQPPQQQPPLTAPPPVALDGLADIPPLEQPSDVEHSQSDAASSPSTSSTSISFSSSPSSGISFDPPILAAPTTRFLDAFTPLKEPSADATTTPTDATAASLRDQLSAYKRRKTEQSSARSQLNAIALKRGGEDYIDLNPYSAMTAASPQPPPARPQSAGAAGRSELFAPWVVREYRHANFTLRLHEELLDFAAFISPAAGEEKRRAALLSRLSDLTTSLFPSSTLRPFGSYATKLYLPMGDLDVCLFDAPTNALHQLHRALEREGWASYLEHITSARIPIVKFMDRSSGLRVDVCADQRVGQEAAQYVVAMSVKFPAFRPLLLFLKYFLHVRRLNDTYSGGVGSFLLQLMLLSHLHHHPAQTHDCNLGLLLLSFFDTYGNQLNYQSVGISLSPPSFYNKHDRSRYNPQRPLLLSVENPLDSTHDVGVNSFGVMRVRRAMQYGYGRLVERSVMEGRWEGSLLAMVLGVVDDEELRERGEKKEREREKREKRDKEERKEVKKAKKEKRRREEKEEKKDDAEEEEGEITVLDDSDDEKSRAGQERASEREEYSDGEMRQQDDDKHASERDSEEEEGAYHERQHDSDEEKEKDNDEEKRVEMREENKDASIEEKRGAHAKAVYEAQAEEQKSSAAEEEEEKTEQSSASSSAEPSASATTSSSSSSSSFPSCSVPSSSSSATSSTPTSSASSSSSKKWQPGQPFPEKWLRLFNQRNVTAVMEVMELDEATQAESLEQFKRERQVWQQQQQQLTAKPEKVKEEKQQGQAKPQALSEQKEEAAVTKKAEQAKTYAELTTYIDRKQEAEERYFLSWRAHQPFPSEWLRQFDVEDMGDLLERRADLDERTRRRLLLDFKRDKEDWRSRRDIDTAPMTVETWKGNVALPAEWLHTYSERTMKQALDKRADLGKKAKKASMLQQFRDDRQSMKQREKEARETSVAEEMKAQPGLYDVQEEWLTMSRAQVDKLLQERGMSEELRPTVLRQWKEALMSKTDSEARKRKEDAGQWTAQDEQEWQKWRRIQRMAKVELPKHDGVEVFRIPVEWLEWDKRKVKDMLKSWNIKGEVKIDVLGRWQEMKNRKDAGVAVDNDEKGGKRSSQAKSEKRLKEELQKLELLRRKRRDREEKELSNFVVEDDNDSALAEAGSSRRERRQKRQREKREKKDADEDEEEHEKDEEEEKDEDEKEAGTSSKRQRLEENERVDDDWQPPLAQAQPRAAPGKPMRKSKLKAMLMNEVKEQVLERMRRERRPSGFVFPHTADEHALYESAWEAALEERVEAELAGRPPPVVEQEPPLSEFERDKVRRHVRPHVLRRLIKVNKAEKKAAGVSRKSTPSFPHTAAHQQLYSSEVEKEVNSKTPAQWRERLDMDEAEASIEEEKRQQHRSAATDRYGGADPATVKQVRRQLIDTFREQRRAEYEARKKTPPTQLAKLFPVDGSDQRKLEEALLKELDKLKNQPTGDKQQVSVSEQNGHSDSSSAASEQKAAASAAPEPEVIDLIDDDESVASASAAAAAASSSSVGDAEGWAEEETSARPKRRAADDDDAQSSWEEVSEEKESARSSKRVKVDADQQQSSDLLSHPTSA